MSDKNILDDLLTYIDKKYDNYLHTSNDGFSMGEMHALKKVRDHIILSRQTSLQFKDDAVERE